MNFYIKKKKHPHISGTYINGFVKDVPLRGKDFGQIEGDIELLINSCKFLALKEFSIKKINIY